MSPEQYAKIRRLHFSEGWKVNTIATELRIHHSTVKRALENESFSAMKARPKRKSQLDPYRDFITETLKEYPKLRASRLYLMVKERGYTGSEVQIRRFVKYARPKGTKEPYFWRESAPGEEAQVDWAHFGQMEVFGTKRKLSLFVMTLSYSRAMYARFFFDQKLESFFCAHIHAFEYFGGVPRKILHDNLKAAVADRIGEHVRFHPDLMLLAGHYQFDPVACAPYRGNEKGKVERSIRYIRDSFFAARTLTTLERLNHELEGWLCEVANRRPHPKQRGQSVEEFLEKDRQCLRRLPEHRYHVAITRPVPVAKTPYVRFEHNDYSVHPDYCQSQVTLSVTEDEVRVIDDKMKVVASHKRHFGKYQRIEDAAHLKALAEQKHLGRKLLGKNRLQKLCPSSTAFLQTLLDRGLCTRHATKALNDMVALYGKEEVDAAIQSAHLGGAYSASVVLQLLEQKRRQQKKPPPVKAKTHLHPKADVEVTPHDLQDYDRLLKEDEE